MRRYVTLSQKPITSDYEEWYDANASDSLARTIYEPEQTHIRTGLLDAQGNDIYCVEDREPIGFVNWDILQA